MLHHPTAIIDPHAQLGKNVQVGPYSVIGPHVTLGEGCQIGPHVVIEPYTLLGDGCTVGPGSVLGGLPQDYGFGGEISYVRIGNEVRIRECVTINRATGEGNATEVGSGSFLMAYSHLGHNVRLGQRVVLANSVQLAGYVTVGDDAFIGGMCVVHQFVTIGRMTIMGGFTGTRQDLPPFALTEGRPAEIRGINRIGLKRKGFDLGQRTRLKQAFHHLFFSSLGTATAIAHIREEISPLHQPDPNVEELIDFVLHTKRGIHRGMAFQPASDENAAAMGNDRFEGMLVSG
jgi:UDP-N-acetylglucosamine acyltransferase